LKASFQTFESGDNVSPIWQDAGHPFRFTPAILIDSFHAAKKRHPNGAEAPGAGLSIAALFFDAAFELSPETRFMGRFRALIDRGAGFKVN
jgi:hypothetical protein